MSLGIVYPAEAKALELRGMSRLTTVESMMAMDDVDAVD
jgi:hypothetical protein